MMSTGDVTSNQAYYVSDSTSVDTFDDQSKRPIYSLRRVVWASINAMVFCVLLLAWPQVSQAQSRVISAENGTSERTNLSIEGFVGDLRIIEWQSPTIEIVQFNHSGTPDLKIVESSDGLQMLIQGNPRLGETSCVRHHENDDLVLGSFAERPVQSFPSLVIAVPMKSNIQLEILGGEAFVRAGRRVEGTLSGCSQMIFEAPEARLFLVSEDAATLQVPTFRRGRGNGRIAAF